MTPVRPTIRILLVDDSALMRAGVRAVLAAAPDGADFEIVGEASRVPEAIRLATDIHPHLVLLDVRLPDGSGFTVCREILKRLPETRLLVLSAFTSDTLLYEAIKAGAHGYLAKEVDPAQLIHAIREVAAGRSVLAPDVTAGVLRLMREGAPRGQTDELAVLSGQERCVLALVAEGKTNKQIGTSLGLSSNTVKHYLASVFDKLQLRRRAQAAAFYVQTVGAPSSPPPPPSPRRHRS